MRAFLQKFLCFFEGSDRKKLYLILFCIVCNGFIEMFSVAAILPFLAVVAKPEVVETNQYLSQMYGFFNFSEPKYMMLFLGGGVFSLLLVGNLFSALTTRWMLKFSFLHGSSLSSRLLSKYLSQPYTYFLSNNSVYLQKNVLSEIDRLVSGIIINICLTLSKVVVCASILGLLLFVDFKLAIIICLTMGGTYWLIYRFVRHNLTLRGELSTKHNVDRYQAIRELTGAIKELKILNRENHFHKKFSFANSEYAKHESASQLMPLLTKYLIEIIAFGGMILVAIYLIWTKDNLNQYLPLLGLYALSGYRIMPAAQQIFSGVAQMRFNSIAVHILHKDFHAFKENKHARQGKVCTINRQLMLEHLHYTYPGASQSALNDISIKIQSNTTIGLVGSSGAGKTTLVDVILGLLKPTSGFIQVDDKKLTGEDITDWQRNIGYVPQSIFLIDSSIKENIALGIPSNEINEDQIIAAAKLANLHDFIVHDLNDGYDTQIGENGMRLSGGQRQRIGIARALYHNPQVLIFDEATSALDNQTEQVIISAIHNLSHKKTIIMIAHRLQTVKNCDVIYIIKNGKIEDKGTYKALMNNNQQFRDAALMAR